MEPNIFIKMIIYILAFSPYIFTFGLFIIMFETFVFRPKRQNKEYQKLVLKVYHNLLANQGEEIANQYLEFRNIEY